MARATPPMDETTRAKEAALAALRRRGLSVAEMRERLVSKGFSVGAIDATLADLSRVGLLGDAALADDLVRSTLERAPAGRALLEHKTEARAVEEQAAAGAIDRAMVRRDEAADALTLARAEAPRIARAVKNDPGAALRRLLSLLLRRGFEEHDAREAASAALREIGLTPDDA